MLVYSRVEAHTLHVLVSLKNVFFEERRGNQNLFLVEPLLLLKVNSLLLHQIENRHQLELSKK
jgi:hypothetical protein